MTRQWPTRRQLLSAGGLAAATAVAGCMSEFGERDQSGDDSEALRLLLSRQGDSLRESRVQDLAETRPEWDEKAFEAARKGERYTTQYRKPFMVRADESEYAVEDGTYYELGSVVVDEAPTERQMLRLFETEDAETPTGDAVPASELPEADQRAVEIAYFAARARGDVGGVPWGLVQRGGYVYRREGAVESSLLLTEDGPEQVTFREKTYTVETTRETFYEPVYLATAEPVAESPDRIEAILRAQLVDARVDRSELSDETRRILEQARADSYQETHPYSDAYESVLRSLHARAFIDGNIRKDAGVREEEQQVVRYNDVYYDYQLRFVPAEE